MARTLMWLSPSRFTSKTKLDGLFGSYDKSSSNITVSIVITYIEASMCTNLCTTRYHRPENI